LAAAHATCGAVDLQLDQNALEDLDYLVYSLMPLLRFSAQAGFFWQGAALALSKAKQFLPPAAFEASIHHRSLVTHTLMHHRRYCLMRT
jgi:hypothetical protein